MREILNIIIFLINKFNIKNIKNLIATKGKYFEWDKIKNYKINNKFILVFMLYLEPSYLVF